MTKPMLVGRPRTAAPPQMAILDAPSREACTMRRERTNTPLQALMLLNEPQYVEASRALAERALHEAGPKAEERLAHLFILATARLPDSKERAELLAQYGDHLARYSRDPEAAFAQAAKRTSVHGSPAYCVSP